MKKFIPSEYFNTTKREFIIDILLNFPSALILLFYSKTFVYTWIISLIKPIAFLYKFLKDYQNIFHFFLIPIAILLPFFGKYYNKINLKNTDTEDILFRILASLNKAVNSKIDRFSEYYDFKKSNKLTYGKTFEGITQPLSQIKILSENLLVILREVMDLEGIKLTTIICKNDSMESFVFHSDFQPKVTIEELNENDSVAKLCLDRKKGTLFSNISKEDYKGFYQGVNKSNIKSLFCYPIAIQRDVKFIFSFSSSIGDTFLNEKKKIYVDIIKEFENRFVLEWYLIQLKKK